MITFILLPRTNQRQALRQYCVLCAVRPDSCRAPLHKSCRTLIAKLPGYGSGFCKCYNVTGVERNRSLGRLFFDFVLKEWLEVGINLANAHIPCLIVLNQLEVDAAEGQNTDNVQHCRYCAEKVGDLPDKAGRKAILWYLAFFDSSTFPMVLFIPLAHT